MRTSNNLQETSFRIDASNKIIMGLPPTREGSWVSVRNYDLSYSLTQAMLNVSHN